MDEKLQKAIAVILADEMEPDRINDYVENGPLASTADEFNVLGVGADELDVIKTLFVLAQDYNGSRGWLTTEDKYMPDDERGPRCRFDDEGNIVGTNY